MRRKLVILLCIACMSACTIIGCGEDKETADASGEAATSEDTDDKDDTAPKSADTYDEYIRSALETVNSDKAALSEEAAEVTITPAPTEAPLQIPTQIPEAQPTQNPGYTGPDDQREAPYNLYTSSDDNADVNDPADSSSSSPDSSSGSSSGAPGVPEPSPTPYITPDEFEVGKCCIYINGESDSAFGTEVVTAINKARKDLGYPELVKNTGLSTCADRRTREVAALREHVRPNGLMYQSLAPEHFKAEMIIVGTQKAEDAVDTLIKSDPVSRRLIFTEKYQSVGASSFKCNGLNYTVVAFGL